MTPPELILVLSSIIEAIGYDRGEHELWVRLRGRGTYIYAGVPEPVYREFLRAESQGAYFNREVTPSYGFRRELG